MKNNGFFGHFVDLKATLTSDAADSMVVNLRQTVVSDRDFADAILIASDPVFDLDVPFILADLSQCSSYEKAAHMVERWTIFRGGESLAPQDQDFRKQVLQRLAAALYESIN